MYSLIVLGFASFLLSLIATPLVRNLVRGWGFLDGPDRVRKSHAQAVPRVGGVPVAFAFALSYVVLLALPLRAGEILSRGLPLTWRLLPAALLVFATGLLDDLLGLTPWQKLIAQSAAGAGAFWAGIRLSNLGGFHLDSWWSLPLTILWIVACSNALNLIDGVDGLAAGVGLFAASTTLLAALLQHNVPLALATVPLVGALLGFLRYNFNPATIFLGDSGSLFIGFLLGCYGILWSQKSATILGMTAPLMALSIPLLDTLLAIARRFLRQQPIFGADRGHIHHRLLDRGFTHRKVSLILYACCALGAVASIAITSQNFSGLVIVVFCVVTWIGIQHLGYVEFGMAGRMFMEGAFRRHLTAHIELHALEQRLVAAVTPEACWDVIQDVSSKFGFHHLEMQLCGQLFQHRNGIPMERCWNIHIPISDYDYLELTRAFDESDQFGAVGAFADVVKRSLAPKLPVFDSQRPRSRVHAAAVGD
jgi:UDP-GlcNAc:undecaprenyl-phosphate GlcNAc-1-phosphate transferase